MAPFTPDSGTLQARTAALDAARSPAGRLSDAALDQVADQGTADIDDLVRRLTGTEALRDQVREDVLALLAACEGFIAAGTITRTEWMPKASCGEDVTEWETWSWPDWPPEVKRLLVIVRDLRRFINPR
jgi:hypothetical protein